MNRHLPLRRNADISNATPARRSENVRGGHERLEDRTMLAAYINEIYFDPPGSGGDSVFEYIELRGDPSGSLDDHYLIILENEGPPLATPGDIDMIFTLDGLSFGSNGFLTMRQKNTTPNQYTVDPSSTNLVNSGSGSGWGSGATSSLPVEDDGNDGVIENSGGTFMLIHVDFGVMGAAAPTLTQALSWDGNGELILPAGWSVVDAIGIHSEFGEAANGRLFADVNFGPEPATNIPAGAEYVVTNFEIEYIGRWGDSTGQTSADWHASNLTDNVLSGYKTMGDFRQSGEPHGLSVAGRHIFYNQSTFDGNTAGASAADNSAIATDKSAYLPGSGSFGLQSLTNYTRGINGVMIDFGGIPGQFVESSHNVAYGVNLTGSLGTTNYDDEFVLPPRTLTYSATPGQGDFIFRMSGQGAAANNSPSTWASAPAPTSITVHPDTPAVGNFRVEIIWANNAIQDRYLEVIVKGGDALGDFNANPGLPTSDVHFWGNLLGETASTTPAGAFARTLAADGGPIITNGTQAGVGITNRLDINKNNSITVAADRGPIVAAGTGSLVRISIPVGGPFAPEGDHDSDAGSGSAIASTLASSTSRVERDAGWISHATLAARVRSEPVAAVGARLAGDGDDSRAHVVLSDEEVDDALGMDNELLDALAMR